MKRIRILLVLFFILSTAVYRNPLSSEGKKIADWNGIAEEREFYENKLIDLSGYGDPIPKVRMAFFGAQAHFVYNLRPLYAFEAEVGLTDSEFAKREKIDFGRIGHNGQLTMEDLKKRNLYEEAKSEFEFIANEEFVAKEGEGFSLGKFPDILNFTPLERRKILELLRYRDEKAKRINKASFRVFGNDKLSQAVREEPNEAKCIERFGKKDGEVIYKLLIAEYNDPIDTSELSKRHGEDLNEEEDKKFQNAKKWRLRIMRVRRMEHSLLPSNKQLIAILKANPQNLEELRALKVFSDWKVDNYGPSLLAALQGISFDNMLGRLVAVRSKEAFIAKRRKKQNQASKDKDEA